MGGTSFADHAHFVIITDPSTGETTCQYLAAGRSEPARTHPLHTRVHTGTPGEDRHGTDFDKEAKESSRCDTPAAASHDRSQSTGEPPLANGGAIGRRAEWTRLRRTLPASHGGLRR